MSAQTVGACGLILTSALGFEVKLFRIVKLINGELVATICYWYR